MYGLVTDCFQATLRLVGQMYYMPKHGLYEKIIRVWLRSQT